MKKLIIGRNDACDIIIPDTTDMVSRKQAVLAISFWGKMILFDTSNNGTYLNGERIETGKGKKVTKKDNINFAHVADLDWSTVHDPYKKNKHVLLSILLFVVLAAGATIWWFMHQGKEIKGKKQVKTELPVDKGETTTTVEQPATTTNDNGDTQQAPRKKKKKKKKEQTHQEPQNDVNQNTPIIN